MWRRLLFGTTETNCIAVGCRSWRTRPCKGYLPRDPPAKTIYRRRLCLATTAHFSDYNSLRIHTQCACASGGLIPSTRKFNHKKGFLIAQMAQQISVTNKSQWQHRISQNANKQHANAHERTSAMVCRTPSADADALLPLTSQTYCPQQPTQRNSKKFSTIVEMSARAA